MQAPSNTKPMAPTMIPITGIGLFGLEASALFDIHRSDSPTSPAAIVLTSAKAGGIGGSASSAFRVAWAGTSISRPQSGHRVRWPAYFSGAESRLPHSQENLTAIDQPPHVVRSLTLDPHRRAPQHQTVHDIVSMGQYKEVGKTIATG